MVKRKSLVKRKTARTGGKPASAKAKARQASTPLCPRCGKAMMLVSQGLTWQSYVCRSCGVGKVEPVRG